MKNLRVVGGVQSGKEMPDSDMDYMIYHFCVQPRVERSNPDHYLSPLDWDSKLQRYNKKTFIHANGSTESIWVLDALSDEEVAERLKPISNTSQNGI